MNKTTICSVVFLDIVEYSKKSVAEQIRLKNRFNGLIAEAIKDVPIADRIILDTGDGAAISFLGDPEDALWTAIKIRNAVIAEQDSPYFLRIGINLGPVRLVEDINKRPNIIGDGINVAQRIMNFAQPNQILVSRTFYDVISGVTADYARLFEYQGARTDKHVREHEIYAVKSDVGKEDAFRAKPVQTEKTAPWWRNRRLLLKQIFPAAAILLILLSFLIKTATERNSPVAPPTPGPAPAAKPAALPASAPIPLPKSAATPVSAPAALPKPPALPKSAPVVQHESARHRHVREKQPQKQNAAKEIKVAPPESATLLFRIMPWGNVYVDGKPLGASPPLKTVKIWPGKHQIEIRNSTLPSYTRSVEPKPGERVIIEHEF